jgi:hypothetical protein
MHRQDALKIWSLSRIRSARHTRIFAVLASLGKSLPQFWHGFGGELSVFGGPSRFLRTQSFTEFHGEASEADCRRRR